MVFTVLQAPRFVDPLNITAMACPALPLCPLAIAEAERGAPDILKRIRTMFDKVILLKGRGCRFSGLIIFTCFSFIFSPAGRIESFRVAGGTNYRMPQWLCSPLHGRAWAGW